MKKLSSLILVAIFSFFFSVSLAIAGGGGQDVRPEKVVICEFFEGLAASDFSFNKKVAEEELQQATVNAAMETLNSAIKALSEEDNLYAVKLLDACKEFCRMGSIVMPENFGELRKIAIMRLTQQRVQEALASYRTHNLDLMDQANLNLEEAREEDRE